MRIIAGLVLVALFVQCEREEEGVDYFPMKVGNEYCYSGFNDDSKCWTKKVWFSTIRQGKKYYAFSSDSLRNYWFYRKKSGTGDVFILDLEEMGEWRGYRFDTAEGDTFHTKLSYGDPDFVARVISRHDTVTTPAGVFTDCIAIMTEYAWGHELWEWFAPEVGPVQVVTEETSYRLTQARIGGEEYPPGP
jgi:hypothetical protein